LRWAARQTTAARGPTSDHSHGQHRRMKMAKWDLSKLENSASVGAYIDEDSSTPTQPTPLMLVMSIRRKADIMRMDAGRGPERLTIKQRAEEIMALCEMLEKRL
jgi:hypothetical protein